MIRHTVTMITNICEVWLKIIGTIAVTVAAGFFVFLLVMAGMFLVSMHDTQIANQQQQQSASWQASPCVNMNGPVDATVQNRDGSTTMLYADSLSLLYQQAKGQNVIDIWPASSAGC